MRIRIWVMATLVACLGAGHAMAGESVRPTLPGMGEVKRPDIKPPLGGTRKGALNGMGEAKKSVMGELSGTEAPEAKPLEAEEIIENYGEMHDYRGLLPAAGKAEADRTGNVKQTSDAEERDASGAGETTGTEAAAGEEADREE